MSPFPNNLAPMETRAVKLFLRYLKIHIEFLVGFQAKENEGVEWKPTRFPSHGLYSSKRRFNTLRPTEDKSAFTIIQNFESEPKCSFGIHVLNNARGRIYKFSAERLGLASAAFAQRDNLDHDARNLASVLNVMQRNPGLFGRYNELIRCIFPSIFCISVQPDPKNSSNVQILVWTDDPKYMRDDLAIELSESGTGIGQVLAILYVVLTAKYPQAILIDEPNSFLHPAAGRKLIEVLKLFPKHQYIIATHSPEILRAAQPAAIQSFRWSWPESTVETKDATDMADIRHVLNDIGVKLSDVFGADYVLWVEGDTEEVCYALILNGHLQTVGVNIVGVRKTGDFTSKRIPVDAIVGIYEKLSRGNAVLPPAVGFIFDREERAESRLDEILQRTGGKLHFLPRRMFENYLFFPDALTVLMNSLPQFRDQPIHVEEVQNWLVNNGGAGKYLDPPLETIDISEAAWLKSVDGAKLLHDLFQDLSNSRYSYEKVTHGGQLIGWMLKNNPEALSELKAFLIAIIRYQERTTY